MEIELEVKVLGMNTIELEKKVIALGGQLIGEENQVNTLIDSKDKPIKSYLDAYVRIRETKDLMNNNSISTLTLKNNISTGNIKANEEFNVNIENKDVMLNIFKHLGFDDVKVGYKHRRSYWLEKVKLEFDTWDKKTYSYPYMEIEVKNSQDLDKIITMLNIPQENISTKSIDELMKINEQ